MAQPGAATNAKKRLVVEFDHRAKIVRKGGSSMTVDLTRAELDIINNALNEVCNGIHLEGEFHTRMGCELHEARTLLAKIHRLASN
jgi:hypothetical protein